MIRMNNSSDNKIHPRRHLKEYIPQTCMLIGSENDDPSDSQRLLSFNSILVVGVNTMLCHIMP
jgi:hypothetical protein